MPRLEPRLSVRAIRPLVSALKTLGHNAEAIAQKAGLDLELLESCDARVPMCVGVSLLTCAVEETGDSNVGLHLAEHADPRSFDVHYYAMLSSSTLGEAYSRLCRYQRLIHESSRVDLTIGHDRAVLRHWLPGGKTAHRQTAEFLAAAWVRAGRLVTALEWCPLEVRFAHPAPPHPEDHVRFFNCPVHFSSGETAVYISADLLAAPCSRADRTLLALLDGYAADRLEQTSDAHSAAERVRGLLYDKLTDGDPGAGWVAKQLHMSTRTMTRCLASEATSYRSILESVRHQAAVRHLANPDVSVSEIAFLLGFSELSSFHRAFHRWTGRTPAAFRRDLAQPVNRSGR